MNTTHETVTTTYKDGFKTVKKWSYVKKNGHSAWDGISGALAVRTSRPYWRDGDAGA